MSKDEWPELVGKTGEEAKSLILRERPDIREVHILPSDSIVTCDFRVDRVRVFTAAGGKVASTPRVG
jgi:hypothetical protein